MISVPFVMFYSFKWSQSAARPSMVRRHLSKSLFKWVLYQWMGRVFMLINPEVLLYKSVIDSTCHLMNAFGLIRTQT